MIRFIIICLIVFLFLVISIPIFLIELIVGKISRRARDISSLRIIQWIFRVLLFVAGVKATVIGEENVPKDRSVLYVGNHRSYFDIILLYSRCPGLTGFVAKKEMDRYPGLNIWMRFLYCLFLDRNDLRQGMKTIQTATEYVKNGISVCIFPEGTRNKNESELDLLPFHEGSFRIAVKSGCPIIPVSLNNTQEIFEAHLPKIRPTHVVIEYGTPILPGELPRDQQKHLGESTRALLLSTLEKNQAAV